MTKRSNRATLLVSTLLPTLALSLAPSVAGAQDRYRREGRADYSAEIEPHFSFGVDNVYGTTGYGGGLRISIPIAVGHLGRVPQNLAISFGGDIIHYDSCYYGAYCGANYVMLPIAAQWNLFVVRRFSLFFEGGAFLYKGWFDGCGIGDNSCASPPDFGFLPTLAVGGRLHLGDNVSFVARLGYPTSTLGISFM